MEYREQVEPKHWQDCTNMFSRENMGKSAKVETNINKNQVQVIAKDIPFQGLIYDEAGKDCVLTVALGQKKVELIQIVDSPIDIWEERNKQGKIISMEILNKNLDVMLITCKD
jgi:hypothetical protein